MENKSLSSRFAQEMLNSTLKLGRLKASAMAKLQQHWIVVGRAQSRGRWSSSAERRVFHTWVSVRTLLAGLI